MTDKARRLIDRDVLALHDVRVTRRAAQRPASARFVQVRFVVKLHILEFYGALKQSRVVTAGTQTAAILDFGPWLGAFVHTREVVGDHGEGQELRVNGAF